MNEKNKNALKAAAVTVLFAFMLSFCGCAGINYGNAEAFESALNAGENTEGRIVRFKADELRPDSAFGYNIWAGEHLNFVSEEDPGVKENEEVTVRIKNVKKVLGSWIIRYEKVTNAVANKKTVYDTILLTDNAETEEKVEKYSGEIKIKAGFQSSHSGSMYNNDYFDIVGTYTYDGYLNTVVVQVIRAKQNVEIEATAVATVPGGSTVGKDKSDAVIGKDEYGYVRFEVDGKYSDMTFCEMVGVKAVKDEDGYVFGGVEMVSCSKTDFNLYVNVRQTKDKIGEFAGYKLLFFNGGRLVYDKSGFFRYDAENLTGKDSTDTISVSTLFVPDFDEIKFYYEP